MAQVGGVQREPSMEEILASIRRIIEDSDGVRKPDDPTSSVQPANDTTASASPAPAEVAPIDKNQSSVIEVEAFRADLRARPPGLDALDHDAFAEVEARFEASHVPDTSEAPDDSHAGSEPDHSASARAGADAWRLGVPAEEMIDDGAADDDFAAEIASAVLDDLPGEQTETPAASAGLSLPLSEQARAPLLSEQAGKQVAAAFGELSEAFAARSRKNLDEMAEAMLRPMLQDWLDNNLPLLVERLVREEIERVARGT